MPNIASYIGRCTTTLCSTPYYGTSSNLSFPSFPALASSFVLLVALLRVGLGTDVLVRRGPTAGEPVAGGSCPYPLSLTCYALILLSTSSTLCSISLLLSPLSLLPSGVDPCSLPPPHATLSPLLTLLLSYLCHHLLILLSSLCALTYALLIFLSSYPLLWGVSFTSISLSLS